MKLNAIFFLFVAFTFATTLTVTQTSCGKDDKCDTANISYKNDIVPLLKDKGCTASGCHGANSQYPYLTYTEVKAVVDAQRLLGAVKQQAGFSKMPKTGAKIDDCSISILEAWITQGAKDN